ncbi:PUR family DNA/RNA-binding protein [uncultured Bacteroides sp.]|uniref:PUR family DNA/RNA-binding protein n=1 Tax=uncultured Bacteroides sp. TaxID=162156 RepID=UPI002AA8B503|nr:PUR family DNA/RNA-binding protein [uncultured Bacteroides sp.]
MEDLKKKNVMDLNDKEIVFSKSIKAGKRIYYLDVKKNRKDEMFLAITESKKIIVNEGEESLVSFEKHKIFLYKEDFEKFMAGLSQAVEFINERQGVVTESREYSKQNYYEQKASAIDEAAEQDKLDNEIKIDIDFE